MKSNVKSIIKLNGAVVTENTTYFSGGEVQLRVPESVSLDKDSYHIEAMITCSDGIMLLCQLVSILGNSEKTLYLPYLPYGRYDHRESLRDPLSLKVFASIINSLGFDRVVVYDCHSPVGLALIDNCEEISQHEIVLKRLESEIHSYDAIVAPDAGALKKASKLAKIIGKPVIKCDKVRDFQTGKITGFSVDTKEHLGYVKVLIVDDICDGGGTFAGLAAELHNLYPVVDLFVTNGIFSKGKGLLYDAGISKIHAYFNWYNLNI